MKTKKFLQILKENPNKTLEFEYPTSDLLHFQLLPPTYHITEVKNHKIDSVDCGGRMHRFNETVTQLWVNEEEKLRRPWTAGKAFSIYQKVDKVRTIDQATDMLFEYGPKSLQRIIYSVGNVIIQNQSVKVQLSNLPTMCKPREEAKRASNMAAACC